MAEDTPLVNALNYLSIHLSVYYVYPIIWPPHTAASGVLLWAQWPGDINCCTAGAQQQMLAVSCCQVILIDTDHITHHSHHPSPLILSFQA